MEIPEIIDGLKDLIKDRESFIDQNEPDNVFEHDKEILKAAIDALSAIRENDIAKIYLEAYQELLQKSQELNQALLKKLKTKDGDCSNDSNENSLPNKITDEDILSMQSVLPTVAAKYIDETPTFIRYGLQQNRLPFGSAVQNPGGKWSYHISPGLLVAYQKGTLKIEMKPK